MISYIINNYFYTAFTAVFVSIILLLWSISICIQRSNTYVPEVKPSFFQRDLFAVFAFILVCVCGLIGV